MTKKQQRVIDKIQKASSLLFEAQLDLIALNSKGKQFDFVNAPRLSYAIDSALSRAQQVDNIIYQKKTKTS